MSSEVETGKHRVYGMFISDHKIIPTNKFILERKLVFISNKNVFEKFCVKLFLK